MSPREQASGARERATLPGVQRCERHGLATAPDGRCALCRRLERAARRAAAHGHDPWRRVAIVVLAVMAAVAAFALAGALFDTK